MDISPEGETNIRVFIHDLGSTKEGTRGQEVISREQDRIVTCDPLKAMVVCRNMTSINAMPPILDAVILCAQFRGDSRCVVGRRIVDDQDPGFNAHLRQYTFNTLSQIMAVFIARDDDVDLAHFLASLAAALESDSAYGNSRAELATRFDPAASSRRTKPRLDLRVLAGSAFLANSFPLGLPLRQTDDRG